MVATCTGPSSIKLTKAELDEFYTFLFGDTTMGREPTPSLGVLMTAERKAWRLLALHMAKDQTLSIGAALEDIRNNSRFWSMEIDEFCLRKTHLPGPKKGPRTKGKGKAQNKFAKQWDIGRGRGARAWKGKGDPGKSLDKGKPREEWPWASQGEEAAAPPPTPIENRIRSSQSGPPMPLTGRGFARSTMLSTGARRTVAGPTTALSFCPMRRTTGRCLTNRPLPSWGYHVRHTRTLWTLDLRGLGLRALGSDSGSGLLGRLLQAPTPGVAGKLKKGTAGEWEQLVEMDICRDSKMTQSSRVCAPWRFRATSWPFSGAPTARPGPSLGTVSGRVCRALSVAGRAPPYAPVVPCCGESRPQASCLPSGTPGGPRQIWSIRFTQDMLLLVGYLSVQGLFRPFADEGT